MAAVAGDRTGSSLLKRGVDTIAAAGIVIGIGVLFYVDASSLRGVAAGVGYAAIVAIATRFGRDAIIACTVLATALIVAAHFVQSKSGIGEVGELANRSLALLSLWTVALVLVHRIRLQAELASREAVLEQMLTALDLAGDGLYAVSKDGRTIYANNAAREIAAKSGWRSSRPPPASAYPQPGTPLESPFDQVEIKHDGAELEISRVRLPGSAVMARIADVTQRNAATRERRRLEASLQQAAKMEAIGRLAGGIAHDFNNVLGAIAGFAGFLEHDLPEGSNEQSFARRILAACERGKRFVEQILDFARARSIEHSIVDLERVIQECEEHLAPTFPSQITLKTEIGTHVAFVSGSAVQLVRMLANLCVNARDAIGSAGGTITLSLARTHANEIEQAMKRAALPGEAVFGEAAAAREFARLRIADTGSGIASDMLPRIFEPFFTTRGRQRSSGLGLAVVHGVVSAHGGVCHVRSVLGQGTVFSIYLPLVDASAPAMKLAADDEGMRGRERIIVVDDQTDIVDVLAIGLERLGYQVVGVEDPRAALEAIDEDPFAFDVIVTDQVMPGMRGLELIARVRALRPDITAILCTGFSDGATEETARAAGADAFCRKPIDASGIARRIRQLRATRAR